MLLFYTLNWEEYHTGILRTTCNGIPIGCTELQYSTMLFYALPGLCGQWVRDVTLRDLTAWIQPAFATPESVAEFMIA